LDVQEDEAPDRTPPVHPLLRPFGGVHPVHPLLQPKNSEVQLSIQSIIGPEDYEEHPPVRPPSPSFERTFPPSIMEVDPAPVPLNSDIEESENVTDNEEAESSEDEEEEQPRHKKAKRRGPRRACPFIETEAGVDGDASADEIDDEDDDDLADFIDDSDIF